MKFSILVFGELVVQVILQVKTSTNYLRSKETLDLSSNVYLYLKTPLLVSYAMNKPSDPFDLAFFLQTCHI